MHDLVPGLCLGTQISTLGHEEAGELRLARVRGNMNRLPTLISSASQLSAVLYQVSLQSMRYPIAVVYLLFMPIVFTFLATFSAVSAKSVVSSLK